MSLVIHKAISGMWCSFTPGTYLEPKVVALNHCFSVVLLQRGRLGLIHLSIELQREHVIYPVNGITHSVAQLKGIILKGPNHN